MCRLCVCSGVRNYQTKVNSYKVSDEEGLFLLFMPAGSKYWRLKYFFSGKENLLAIGLYPDVNLAETRERHAPAQKALATGNDQGDVKPSS